jgi:predicted phage tail protein
LKWEDVQLNVDGDISEVSIYSTKTKKARTVFVKDATFYLKKLKEEQENLKEHGPYIFHSPKDINEPVRKDTVSKWFRTLTEKALGRKGWNYLLRHSRGTELYRLAKQGKISKDTAIEFMGHSDDMSEVYSHFDKEEIKEMLKNQVYKLEDIPKEKKHELEEAIENLKKENENLKAGFEKELNDLKQEQNEKLLEFTTRISNLFSAAKKSSSLNTAFLKAATQDNKVKAGMRKYVNKGSV